MEERIIGREAEKKILKEMLSSKEAELIAILGRRRIGKTFLIRNYRNVPLSSSCFSKGLTSGKCAAQSTQYHLFLRAFL